MITEDYVSFETAKLLKEKGFRGMCDKVYYNKTLYDITAGTEIDYEAPSLSMAMKWLREKYKICIEPYSAAMTFGWTISSLPHGSHICNEFDYKDLPELGFQSWEEAVEAALKYSLENLI